MLYNEAFIKERFEMINEAIDKLRAKTDISDFSDGSVIKSLLDVIYDEIAEVREDFSDSIPLFYLSTSSGEYLEEIGKLFNCERNPGESDDNYRYRIVRQTQKLAKANETAIRLGCISVNGVHDIILRDYVRGTGTFDAYVITEDPRTPTDVVENVQEKIDEIQAKGIDGRAIKPKTMSVSLNIRYIFFPDVNNEDISNIIHEAENKIRAHIENIPMGGELIAQQIVADLMEINREKIRNAQITNMFIDEVETLISDKELEWDERFYPKNINIS